MITNFKNYNRQPLYHYTFSLKWVYSDYFKIDEPAYSKRNIGKSLSLTRSLTFSEHGSIRIVLNTDLLIRAGYIPKPVCELGIAISMCNKNTNTSKVNYHFRLPEHNVDSLKDFKDSFMKKSYPMQIEYEERIYKQIENLGKYIISVDLIEKDFNYYIKDDFFEYVNKYPHIKLFIIDENHLYIKKEVNGTDYINVKMKDNSTVNKKINSNCYF